MIKKGFTILLVLLTTIVLIGHAVIPHHHHHNYEICIANPEKSLENEKHNHCDCDGNEEHNKTEDNLYCILQKILFTRSDNSEQECKFLKFTDYHSAKYKFVFFHTKNSSDFYLSSLYKEFDNLLTTQTKSNFVKLTNGLRAPPLA